MSDVLKTGTSPMQIRQELEEMVIHDLLGPAGGPEEEVDDRSIRDRYLVGALAPRVESVPRPAQRPARQPEDEDEAGEFPPVLSDELSTEGYDEQEDGPVELSTPVAKATFPSSFGMTFCVRGDVERLQVIARWGQYEKQSSAYLLYEKSGNPKRVWKRTPRGGKPHTVDLQSGIIAPFAVDEQCPKVIVQGIVRLLDGDWIVTLFLVNNQLELLTNRDTAWLFQPELAVEATDGSPIFRKKVTQRGESRMDPLTLAEERAFAMLYRRQVEFAVGHGVGVHWETPEGVCDEAKRISTSVVPAYEVPVTTPPKPDDAERNPAFARLADLVLDMKELAETEPGVLRPRLEPLVLAYEEWIEKERQKVDDPASGLSGHEATAHAALDRCRATLKRIREGLDQLDTDAKAAEAFRFMNRAMWLQRTRSVYSEKIRRGGELTYEEVDIPQNRTWYPFQLAFILLNLPGVTQLDHPDRSVAPEAVADLLWFPTGGGKTEAYLGLAAYTMGLRRLQGSVEGRSGEDGVAVLMRYTLRLLTIQQFQRATALLCACEVIRRESVDKGDHRWGRTPFRLGLWVGRKTTPNKTDQSAEAVRLAHGQREGYSPTGGYGSPYQLTNCPWCGSKIESGKSHVSVESYEQGAGRTWIYCGDPIGDRCPFTSRSAPREGLPVVVVDEEIYRRLPSMLISTVDKFAQMPWNGAVQMLFGRVTGYCDRHGFVSPEMEDVPVGGSGHPQTRTGQPRAKCLPHAPLRPPDLIIQDELHLISGPLGTLVGLYETAIDKLCTWEVAGKRVRPKVIASTATIRKAQDQVHALFARKVNVFPSQGLDVEDNFFALQRKPCEHYPGRRYLGVCAPGRRLKAVLIRVYTALLSAGQFLYEKHGRDADSWMTLVGYFNSMRELGGMRRMVDDDVRTRLRKMEERGLAKRVLLGTDFIEELTSRIASTQIPSILDKLEIPFDPDMEVRRKEMARRGDFRNIPLKPLDVLLATNMISVGVDVKRLGLMVVGGQPKMTSEYIQATSRVGRSSPGLVFTVLNWARPRDLSHYETFEHYHATFYKHVEPLSVTPFSPGALSRGLAALLVSCVRLEGTDFNANPDASKMATESGHDYVQAAIQAITERAALVGGNEEVARFVEAELKRKLDVWQAEAQRTTGGRTLGYKTANDGLTVNLLHQPGVQRWEEFTCLNSLREVEPSVRLILDDHGLDEEHAVSSRTTGPEATE